MLHELKENTLEMNENIENLSGEMTIMNISLIESPAAE